MMSGKSKVLLGALALAAACQGRSDQAPARPAETVGGAEQEARDERSRGGIAPASPAIEKPGDMPERNAMASAGRLVAKSAPDSASGDFARGPGSGLAADRKDQHGGKDETPAAPSRAWFPETFLFEPLVVTDAQGAADVTVKVPDRLTTWRVLALAHSRTGAQGGAATSFLGTLPAYVDAVVPPFLMVGDQVRLPIQLVNTTDAPIASTLRLEAEGATVGPGPRGPLTLPAAGSRVEYAALAVTRPGKAILRAALGTTDAVVRTFDVLPTGRPVTQTKSGTLAAPRTLTLTGAAGSDPASDRVRLLVYPGALALLRAELSASSGRGGVADDAYALFLAGRAPALLQALGDTPDAEALRTLSILSGQRVIRWGRSPDVPTAALLAQAALAHPDNPVLARLGERTADLVARSQRPDGTFEGATGWTLQRLLVTTADCVRAVQAAATGQAGQQRAAAVTVRAQGAYERNLARIEDAYTAAAILAGGGVTGGLADKLRAKVKEALVATGDGAKVLPVPAGVVRGDGSVPTQAEATALAVLALDGDKDAPLADLGAALLGGYSPSWGWGDGRANLVCMQAVLRLFKDPIPAGVKITLTMDGKPVAAGALDQARLREVLALDVEAPGLAGAHEWKLVAEPAVPGLGYSLTLHSWVPWGAQEARGGVELALAAPESAQVGKPADVQVTAIAPSGRTLTITQSLPAGVQVDTPSLQALVDAGTLSRFDTSDGKVVLVSPPLAPAQTFSARYRVIPTLAGTLHSSASTLDAGGVVFFVPPVVWTVR